MDSRSAVVDGIHMRWLEAGFGFPVVLVHGIPTSPALWRKVAPRIDGARVCAWEMVGYGESIPEGFSRDISLTAQAGYLRAWMRELGLPPAVLVGHDLGGGVVQITATRDPALCAGLVLANAVGYDSWPIPAVKAMRGMSLLLERLPDSVLKLNLKTLLYRGHDDKAVARESLRIHLAPYLHHGGMRALLRQMKALHTEDTLAVESQLPRLKGRIPARVVWGAADPFQKIEYGERFARDLGAELMRIEGGKHFVPEDHPDVLAAAIEATVRDARARSWASASAPPPP